MRNKHFVIMAVCLLTGLGVLAAGGSLRAKPQDNLANRPPVYDPQTKSYFQLRMDNRAGYWKAAKELAEEQIFYGVQGRLAVVDSEQTHHFLLMNFNKIKQETWIGMYYDCASRKLFWSTGAPVSRSNFSIWHAQWYRNPHIICSNGGLRGYGASDQFMPVYYTPLKNGFRWQASGPGKGFESYFVEFPTGGPVTPQDKKKYGGAAKPAAKAEAAPVTRP